MYGQGYRNKEDRKRSSQFVVSDRKSARIRAEKEGGYAQNEKLTPSYGRDRKFLIKPSAFESEIHPSHKSKICTQDISPCRELFVPETAVSS